jgi:predicted dienelactone hydrolase
MSNAVMNVGCRALDVHDAEQGVRLPLHVLYPTAAPARTTTFGPYALDLAIDAAVAELGALPLALISHGNGGSPWAYRGMASHLASAGIAVALVEHLGNSRTDNALAGTPANLANRPRHVRLALDAVYAALGDHLAPSATVIGHSIGGYTALAVAGGRPSALPRETSDGVAQAIPVTPDPRVRAVALLAPALPWYMGPGALAEVRVPVLVRTGERDDLTPPWVTEKILAGLPEDARLDYRVEAGAGHFAWITPVPPALAGPHFPPAQDPAGFDRAGYLDRLYPELVAFVRA